MAVPAGNGIAEQCEKCVKDCNQIGVLPPGSNIVEQHGI